MTPPRRVRPHLGRRPLLAATATGGLAVAGLAAANRSGLLGGDPGADAQGVLQLSDTASGVRSLEYPLGEDVLPAVGPAQWRTGQLPTSIHSMVAVTWLNPAAQPTLEISSRRGGTWRPWQPLLPLHDLPDADSDEGNGRTGTDLAWIGPADGIRVRLSGQRPQDLTLVLLHPAQTQLLQRRTPRARRAVDRLKPELLTRQDWDADPAWRDGTPSFNATIEQVHVHHTVNSNDYALDDVAGLIRGMYSYHTKNLGWSDIAYNFLVDRFGRTWVGRAGGPSKPVRGAHTLGFNATSTGIAAIGNYDTVQPSKPLLDAIAQLAAWKLGQYGRDPQGRVSVSSEGSDRYRTGTRPRLPVIDGHRDTNDTACPGGFLYAALPTVRRLAQEQLKATTAVQVVIEPGLSGALVVDATLLVAAGEVEPSTAEASVQWLRGGAAIPGATAAAYRATSADVGALLTVAITYAADGHEPTSRTLTTRGPVRAVPSITVSAASNRRGLTVTVNVTADGATSTPTGTVIVSLPGRRRSVVMSTGRVRVRFRRPVRGPRRVLVQYAGNDQIISGTVEKVVEQAAE